MGQRATETPKAADEKILLSADELRKIDAYWRACNYLSLGMLYLCENPLLREPLKVEHLKKRLVGHWGSDPGQSFIWVHLNRLIKKYDLNVIYIAGPGHGGQRLSLTLISKEDIPRSTRIRARTPRACASSSSNFLFPGELAAIALRKRPDQFMRVANWVIAHRMLLVRLSTILI